MEKFDLTTKSKISIMAFVAWMVVVAVWILGTHAKGQSLNFNQVSPLTKYGWQQSAFTPQAQEMLVLDIDGDGNIDIATIYYNTDTDDGANSLRVDLTVAYNNGNGNIGDAAGFGPNSNSIALNQLGRTFITSGDVDNDGDPDLITFTQQDNLTGGLRLVQNDKNGSGTFNVDQLITVNDEIEDGIFPNINKQAVYGAVLTDMNGDNYDDLVFQSHNKVFVFTNTQTFPFFNNSNFTSVSAVDGNSLVVVNYDGDGDKDIIVGYSSSYLPLINTAGTFTASSPVNLPGGVTSRSLHLADLRGSSLEDLVVETTSDIKIFENDGTGFSLTANNTLDVSDLNILEKSLEFADINDDGVTDVLGIHSGNSVTDVFVFLNQGGGSFGSKEAYAPTGLINRVRVADFNGDNSNDFVALNFVLSNYLFVNLQDVDNTAPTISSLSPAHSSSNVPLNATFTATFDEPIQKGSGSITVKRTSDDVAVFGVTVTSPSVTVSGNTLSFVPFNGNTGFHNTGFYVEIAPGAVEDLNGNDFAGIAESGTWTIMTEDLTPYVSSVNPGNGSTDVAVDANFVIQYSRPVQKGSGVINFNRQDNDVNVLSVSVASSEVSISGSTVTINPTSGLPNDLDLYVRINSLPFESAEGIDAEQVQKGDWNFTTEAPADNTPPSLSSLSPAHNAAGVALSATFNATFNEPIQKGSAGGITVKRLSDNVAVYGVPISDGSITVAGSTLSFTPFAGNTAFHNNDFYVEIGSQAIEDLNGNAFAGISGNGTWKISTVDLTPYVVSVTPGNGSSDVAVDENFVIQYSRPVQKGSGVINFNRQDNDVSVLSVSVASSEVTISGSTATINPNTDLPNDLDLYVRINTLPFESAEGIDAEQVVKGDWNFSTEAAPDTDPPLVSSFSPADDATGVDGNDNLIITFNEDILPASSYSIIIREFNTNNAEESFLTGSNRVTISGNTVTVDPTNDLPAFTQYYVQVTGLKDLAGNNFAGFTDNSTWNFVVGQLDNDPPTITSLNPVNNATGVDPDIGTFSMTFSEPVFPVPGTTIRLRRVAGNAIIQEFPVDGPNVTITGNSLTINNVNSMSNGVSYWLQGGTVLKDAAGNLLTGWVNNSSTWSFTTDEGDVTPPQVSSFSPADDAVNVSPSTNLVIDFNEDLDPSASYSIIIRQKDTNVSIESFLTGSPRVTISGSTVTVDPTSSLPSPDQFYVQITGFRDLAGNNFAGFTDDDTWNFIVGAPELDAPVITSLSPQPNATDVSVSTNLVITFDEPVFVISGGRILMRTYDIPGLAPYEEIQVSSGQVTGSGTNTITIDPVGDIAFDFHTFIQITDDAFEDQHGNVFGGLFGIDDWDFFTESNPDTQPPVITALTPADDATDVDISTNLVIEFDEDVVLGNSSFLIKYYDTNVNQFVIGYSSPQVTHNGNVVTINPPSDLALNTHYWVQINPNTITDASGNNFPGIVMANRDDWDFFTEALAQTITFDPIADKTFGDGPFGISASATSGFSVSFEIVSGPATINNNIITITGTGDVTVKASQAGGNEYAPAPDVERTFTVNKADQVITIDPIADKLTSDGPIMVSAMVDSGLPLDYQVTGPATISGTTITLNGTTGIVTVTASQAGNTNYNAASEQISFNVTDPAKQDQTITFDPISNKVFGDAPFTTTASASSGLPVTFSIISGPATVSGSEITITGAGSVTVAANQAGDNNFNPAQEAIQSFDVAKADQTISFDPIINKVFGDAPFTVSASASSGLDVVLSIVSGPASVNGSEITITGAGSVEVAANQAGDDNFNLASEVTQGFDVAKADQSITIDAISNKLTTDDDFDVVATVDSGLDLTYEIAGPATITGTTVSLTGGIGTVTITVSQVGNANYNAASADVSFSVNEPSSCPEIEITGVVSGLSCSDSGDASIDITVTGGDGDYSYSWSNSTTTEDLANLAAGEYTVTVTDGNGCAGSKSFTIAALDALVLEIEQTADVLCAGGSDANINLTVSGGIGPYSYLWNDGETTEDLNGVAAGIYDVVVTDGNGCTADTKIEITEPSALEITGISTASLDIQGDGTIDITVSGGTAPYTYAWDNDETTEDLGGLFSGVYIVTVTDANGCTEQEEFTVDGITAIEDELPNLEVFPNPTVDYLKISGVENASWSLINLAGLEVKSGSVASGITEIDVTGLRQGVYLLQIQKEGKAFTRRIIKQ